MREIEELHTLGKILKNCDKDILPSLDEVDFKVKEMKEKKLQKIAGAMEKERRITMINGIPVMINHVSDKSVEDVMADYIQSFARITY